MPRMAEEIYVSTDVEADGPIPGPHSMLSFGSAGFRRGGEMVGTFAVNLELLPGGGSRSAHARVVALATGGVEGLPGKLRGTGHGDATVCRVAPLPPRQAGVRRLSR